MSRTPEQVVEALAAAARLAPFDGSVSWFDALFTADGELDPTLPDRALLLGLAEEYATLDEHLDTLPAAAHRTWLADILAIPRLPVVADQVVAHVQVDPKLAPAVVPLGTTLRGGKDAFGNERRYRTVDALTAHGAALTGVRSLVPGGTAGGLPGVAGSAPEFPLAPLAGADAPHVLRISSPALAFEGGNLTALITFDGAVGQAGLSGAGWRYSRLDGTVSTTTATISGPTATIVLTDDCGSPDGDPWVEWVVPATHPVPEGFAFTGVRVGVAGRSAFVPQGAFYNDGALDITKEFEPFGPVAKRGDAFYLRCDEAFGKDLDSLQISVDLLGDDGDPLWTLIHGTGVPHYLAAQAQGVVREALGDFATYVKDELAGLVGSIEPLPGPRVRWQRYAGGQWLGMGSTTDHFADLDDDDLAGGSARFIVSGQEGHYVRAYLSHGDFGWTDYQYALAAFATDAVAEGTPTMPVPPVPPVASSLYVSYTTRGVAAARVESTSGWRYAVHSTASSFHPFRRAVSDAGATGMVALGLELPEAAFGSTVSVYFEVDSAAPCGNTDPVPAGWQWWDGDGWQELPVADGSHQLRESGLLRFVAPSTWGVGCRDVAADAGRWVRLVTGAPDRLGTIRSVVVDAVVAEFMSAAPDPEQDPSPATALPPGTIKGTLSPIRGVKKVTNLASVRGRGPEADPAYQARASARVRHRNRALVPWDYEQHVTLSFPEVAAVRCLPHTSRTSTQAPGSVGLVVVPDRPDPAPRPSVSLIGRIVDRLAPLAPVGAQVAVLCPSYEAVTVVATIRLRRGVAALTGQQEIRDALEAVLHPTHADPPRWGRALYSASLIAFLEQQPSVDVVRLFDLRNQDGDSVESVEVDPCRGLYCSSGAHVLTCEEQL